MRNIEFGTISEKVEQLCMQASFELPADVRGALESAARRERNPRAAKILEQLSENARIAKEQRKPLCQDTGIAVVFIEQGSEVFVRPPAGKESLNLWDAVNSGVKAGYEKGFLRKSVVSEPLNKRSNTGTNTPAIIHHSVTGGEKLKITVMTKGGGCENKSAFKMFNPTEEKEEVMEWVIDTVRLAGADACPPFLVGVGIGGDFEYSCLLSKKALLRKIGSGNKEPFYARLEMEMLRGINELGIGPQGLGGDTTALACLIETAGCHIASLPVAVNIECHSHRHKTALI